VEDLPNQQWDWANSMTLRNKTKASIVGNKITVADTSLARLTGLLGKRKLDAGCGLLIRPSSGVHTFGMLFAIDVVALSRNLRVIKVWHRLAPFRVTSISFRVHSVLELAAGEIQKCGIEVGDQLELF
jgi:uncharacterized membrane protein (UPF0127 family)